MTQIRAGLLNDNPDFFPLKSPFTMLIRILLRKVLHYLLRVRITIRTRDSISDKNGSFGRLG